MTGYSEIDKCRICGNEELIPIVSLGDQYLSGVFPDDRNHLDTLTHGPLDLVKCEGSTVCGLLQLRQSYVPGEMYGDNYGYRSGLNPTMVKHLRSKVRWIESVVDLKGGDLVVDIGSNDSTLLQAYPTDDDMPRDGIRRAGSLDLVGIDPTGDKFRHYYPNHIKLIPDFFTAMKFRDEFGGRKAKVVTSIAMFYDLEDPVQFMREVHSVLADDGIWVLEQSYMPTMLSRWAYDTICHEHLEYYAYRQLKWMAERTGFRILDVELNEVNGGSFSIVLAKRNSIHFIGNWSSIISVETAMFARHDLYSDFAAGVEQSRNELRNFLTQARSAGKLVCGLGASTKGNVILQYCSVTERELMCIGDVNSDKFGCFTPGTQIPILPEQVVLAMKPDYLLVLPWHFRSFFEGNAKFDGIKLVFPLPTLSVR